MWEVHSSIVRSEELKLSCNINLVSTSSNGISESNQYNQTFEVVDYGKRKMIIPSSDLFSGVSTGKHPTTVSIEDFSDSNKWDIFNQDNFEDGTSSSTTIRIDRDTGKIWYTHTFKEGGRTLNQSGNGDCEKVNVRKKKF